MRASPARPAVFTLLAVLAVVSSAVALGYQFLWTRRLIDVIGAGTESAARVFGCFFFGLSLGAAAARKLAAYFPQRPFLLLAMAELTIALLSIPIFLLPIGFSPAVGGVPGASLILTAVAIIPPAVLMGIFLPVLMITLRALGYRLGGGGLLLYAANTIGGVFGLTLLLVWVVPSYGLTPTWMLLMSGNLLIALTFIYLQRCFMPAASGGTHEEMLLENQDSGPRRFRERGTILLLSFFSGWFVLAWEIVALQALFLQSTITFHTPAAILACVLLLLAAGASLVAALSHRISTRAWFPPVVVLTSAAGAVTPMLFFFFADTALGAPGGGGFVFWIRLVALTLLVFGPVFFAASFWFPLLTEWWDRAHGEEGATRWGWLLALNGVGGLIGAEFAFRFLLPALGPFGSMGVLALAPLVALAILFMANGDAVHERPITFVSACALASFLIWASSAWFPQLPVVNPHARFEVLAHWSDRTGNLAVVERPDIGRGLLLNNQYMLGTTSLAEDKARQTQIALATHPSPQRVATLGMATGISAGAALGVDGVRSIDVFELSDSVIAAAVHFTAYNSDLMNHPEVVVHAVDARNGVGRFQAHFDVIVGDLFLPWGLGEGRLFSLEHFRSVHRALAPDGVFVQWLPLYQLGQDELTIIQNTFASVFPGAWQLRLHLRNDQPVVGLFGRKQDKPDPRDTHTALSKPAFHYHLGNDAARLERLWPRLIHAPLADLIAETPEDSRRINTLSNMLVERIAAQRLVNDPERRTYLNYESLGL